MARLIRTEYIKGLEKILAFKTEPVVSDYAIAIMIEVVRREARIALTAVALDHPATTIVSTEAHWDIYVNAEPAYEVKQERDAWSHMLRDLVREQRDRNANSTRGQFSFARLQEHARVQLAWANDLTSATVNLTRQDVDFYYAGIRHMAKKEG